MVVFLRIVAITIVLLTLASVAGGGAAVWWMTRDLPDHRSLAAYEPSVLSRAHAADGVSIATFARENRVFVPIEEIPELVKQAFVSAEDKNFYEHPGIDLIGIAKAVVRNVSNYVAGRRLQGASTIPQQVAKNMLLSPEATLARKIREGVLALRIVDALTKERILELYLNEIFLGGRAYGVAAAALTYFGKSLDEIELHEAAFLAALPKAPNNYHPARYPERALERRSYVLWRMAEDGFVSPEEAEAAELLKLGTRLERLDNASAKREATYFMEEVRRILVREFGENALYGGGLSVRTTLSRRMQSIAEAVLRRALEKIDRKEGYAGPVGHIEGAGSMEESVWRSRLADIAVPRDIDGWRLAVVLDMTAGDARIGVEGLPTDATDWVTFGDMAWARRRNLVEKRVRGEVRRIVQLGPRPRTPSDLWRVGDVIHVARTGDQVEGGRRYWSLRQVPEVQGALLALDPRTGRVLAMQGGFSFDGSPFNRAVQAMRQPGSLIKPVVYARALDYGYTPATRVLDAPLAVEQGAGLDRWEPENSNRQKFVGPAPLRRGIVESRNLMTVRVAQDIGMGAIADYARRFGLYEDMPPLPSYALGAGETTLIRLVRAFAVFANGGNRVEPVFIDRVQDRRGRTISRRDDRPCVGCAATQWLGQPEPYVPEEGQRILDPVTAFQITWMLMGAVERGTGRAAMVEELAVAGKTGTTNANRDAWFIGYTPELVVGCHIGYDQPRTLGGLGFGGHLCAPVVGEFLAALPKSARGKSFPRPAGVEFAPVDRDSGIRAPDGREGDGVVIEAFRRGRVPEIGVALGSRDAVGVQSGSGGLY